MSSTSDRGRTLLGGLVLGLCAAFGLWAPRPVVDNTVTAWLDPTAALTRQHAEFISLFGTDEAYVATLTGPDALVLLAQSQALEARFAADPVVAGVLGPATHFAEEVDLLLDPDLGGPAELARLAPRWATPLNTALPLFQLNPPRATVIALSRICPPAEREALDAALEAFRTQAAAAGVEVRLAGMPSLNLALDRAGRSVQTEALPLLIGVCVLLLLALTRSLRQTVAALVPVGLGVLATDGMLGAAHHPSNLLVDIVKPLIFVLILAAGLHIITGYASERRQGLAPGPAARAAVREKGKACTLALLTTAIGFGSLILAPVRPIQVFGALAAAGLVLAVPLVLLGLPTVLVLLRAGPGGQGSVRLARLAGALVGVGLRHRVVVIAGACLIIAGGVVAWPHLTTDPHAIRYFAPDHPLRRDHEAIEAGGLGLGTVELVVAGSSATTPAGLALAERLEAAAARLPGVQRVVGGALLLREASVRAGGPPKLPQGPILEAALAAPELARFVAPGRAIRIALLVGTLDAAALDTLGAALRAQFAALQPPAGLTLVVTGSYGLLLDAQRGLLSTLQQSLLGTALLIELILLGVLRSPRLALLALLPNAVPVAALLVVMALVGLPLDLGTCMTAAVALGIAVDDTLHLLTSWQKTKDLNVVVRTTGDAVLLTSVVIGAGFAVLIPSSFGPTHSFGLLCAIAMGVAVLADLLVVPALIGPRSSSQI